MKGPYERLKYDLRRLWECPQCKRRERTGGGVTFRFCTCRVKDGEQPTVMHLVADGPQRLVPVIARPRPERVEEPAAAVPAAEFLAGISAAENSATEISTVENSAAENSAAENPAAQAPSDGNVPDTAGDDATDVE